MRQLYQGSFVATIAVFFLSVAGLQAQVGIGTPFRTQAPNSKAVLHLEADASTPQGFLLPRLDRAKFIGLTSSDNGMIVYDQKDNQFYYWLNDKWSPLSSGAAVTRETWLSGVGAPTNTVGIEGDFYFDSVTKDLYRKTSSGVYSKLFSLDADRFWISDNPSIHTYTVRNVGIGVIAPIEKLEVNGSMVSTALKSVGNQVIIGDSNGKLLTLGNGTGVLTNNGSGSLTWEPIIIPNYQAGNGMNIDGDIIENTGDTDSNDDIVESTVAGGDVTGVFSNLVIKPNAITQTKIADGAITTGKISDGSVTELKIADQSITTAKIAPPPYGNMQLVTNAKGVVTWIPSTTATLGAGEIAIGTGTNVNSVVLNQDISLTTSGKVTVLGLLGRSMDNIKTPLIDQVLSYNGAQWTYTSIDATTYANGDVQGLLSNTTVTALQGYPIASTTPSTGQILQWSSGKWTPTVPSLNGDVTGGLTSNTVQQIQTKPLDISLASLAVSDASKVLTWNGSRWAAQNVPVFTLPNTGNGKIVIGNGSTVNSVSMSGDISLANDGTTQVTNLQGKILSASNPLTNQVLKYNGSVWTPSNLLPAGDLDATTNTLVNIQGRLVSATAPSINNVLTWTGSSWQPQPIPTFTLANTANGAILVGNGTSVNSVSVTGDVALSNSGTTQITHLQGEVLSVASPSVNQVLKYNGSSWVASNLLATGDLDATTNTIQKLQGQAVSANAPSLNNVLTWTGTAWQPQAIPTYTLPNSANGQILIGNGTSVNSVGMSQDVTLANDGKATVTGLRGISISSTTPTTNQVLSYNGTQWTAANIPSSISGDASGSFSAVSVDKLKGTNINPLLASTVATDKVLTWDGIANQWIAKAVTIPGAINTGNGEFAIGQGSSTAAKTITGDVAINANGVSQIQSLAVNPLDNTLLSAGDASKVLTWNGSKWTATSIPASSLSGDITGSLSTSKVAGIQGTSIDPALSSAIATNKVLTWDGAKWTAMVIPAPVNLGAAEFSIGQGSSTVAKAITGDIAINTNGQATIQKIATNPVDNVVLSTSDANKVLTWNGTKWVAASAATPSLSGDVTGAAGSTNVGKIQGSTIDPSVGSLTILDLNKVLTWNGTRWIAATPGSLFSFSGDAVSLQGTSISSTAPTGNQVLMYNSGSGKWEPATGINATQLQGQTVNASTPTAGNILYYDGSDWITKNVTDVLPLSTGKIFIGNATNKMTEQTVSQDVSLAANGQATVAGLQGKPIDASAATLTAIDDGKVLAWDGITSKWTPKTAAAVAIPALETQTYTAAQTRYYSVDPSEFISVNTSSVDVFYTGTRGRNISPTSGSTTYAAATLHLPHGAIVTEIKFLCYDNKSGKDIDFYYTKNSMTGITSDIGSVSSTGSSGDQTLTYSTTDTIDNQNYSYKVVAAFTDNAQLLYGVRVKYTVTKPD